MPDVHLILGDCLEKMKDIPDNSIDMILADPPYQITKCKWDIAIPLEPMWEQINRVIKPNRAIILMAGQPFTSKLILSNLSQFKTIWYWDKERGTNFVQAKRYPMKVIEECVLFCNGTPLYKPKMVDVKPYRHVLPKKSNSPTQNMDSSSIDENGGRIYKEYNKAYPKNILKIPRDNMVKGKSLHPTQKPVALFQYLIETYTNVGDTVLDFCMGSGTTGIAALNSGRNFIGMEITKKYYEIAKERIKNHEKFNIL